MSGQTVYCVRRKGGALVSGPHDYASLAALWIEMQPHPEDYEILPVRDDDEALSKLDKEV